MNNFIRTLSVAPLLWALALSVLLTVSGGGGAQEKSAECVSWNSEYAALVTDFNNDFAKEVQAHKAGRDLGATKQAANASGKQICNKEEQKPEGCVRLTERPPIFC